MLDFEKVADVVSELTALPFFPSEDGARRALIRTVSEMASEDEEVGMAQIRWVMARMTSGIYSAWPGVAELRACFCDRFKPRDGINAYSMIYPNGLPPSKEAQAKQLATPELPALPPGHVASVDPELDQMIVKLAKVKAMPRGFSTDNEFSKLLRETITAPADRPAPPPAPVPTNSDYKPITQADVDLAVAEFRAKKHAEAS